MSDTTFKVGQRVWSAVDGNYTVVIQQVSDPYRLVVSPLYGDADSRALELLRLASTLFAEKPDDQIAPGDIVHDNADDRIGVVDSVAPMELDQEGDYPVYVRWSDKKYAQREWSAWLTVTTPAQPPEVPAPATLPQDRPFTPAPDTRAVDLWDRIAVLETDVADLNVHLVSLQDLVQSQHLLIMEMWSDYVKRNPKPLSNADDPAVVAPNVPAMPPIDGVKSPAHFIVTDNSGKRHETKDGGATWVTLSPVNDEPLRRTASMMTGEELRERDALDGIHNEVCSVITCSRAGVRKIDGKWFCNHHVPADIINDEPSPPAPANAATVRLTKAMRTVLKTLVADERRKLRPMADGGFHLMGYGSVMTPTFKKLQAAGYIEPKEDYYAITELGRQAVAK